jgi:hypothetical protein
LPLRAVAGENYFIVEFCGCGKVFSGSGDPAPVARAAMDGREQGWKPQRCFPVGDNAREGGDGSHDRRS